MTSLKKIRHAKKQKNVAQTPGEIVFECVWMYLTDKGFKALIIKMFKIKGNHV